MIVLDRGSRPFDTFADLIAASSQVGNDVVIDYGNGHSLTLENLTINQLRPDDFSGLPNPDPAPGNDDSIGGGPEGVRVNGSNSDDTLFGTDGDDTIDGNAGSDTIFGGAGNDQIRSGTSDGDGCGGEFIFGDAGDDTIDGSALTGGGHGLIGGTGDDVLIGGNSDEFLNGDELGDSVAGGNDTLTGGGGRDLFELIDLSSSDVITDFTPGEDRISLNIETSPFATFADLIAASSQVGDDVVIDYGNGHSLTLKNLTVEDLEPADFRDLPDPDPALGNDDTVGGGANDDTVGGGANDDTVGGGSNDDTVGGGANDDTVGGGANDDTVGGGANDDTVGVGANDDTIGGGSNDDTVGGSANDDTVGGGANDDTIGGGSNDDTVFDGPDGVLVNGGNGDDIISGGDSDDTLAASIGADTLFGGDGADTFVVFGGADTDVIADFNSDQDVLQLVDDRLRDDQGQIDTSLIDIVQTDQGTQIVGQFEDGPEVLVTFSTPVAITVDDLIL